jgi:hypothetical protein
MLRNQDLAGELDELAAATAALARRVEAGGELPGRQLAAATVEAVRLAERLAKLTTRVDANGGGRPPRKKR